MGTRIAVCPVKGLRCPVCPANGEVPKDANLLTAEFHRLLNI
jgi:hypothetical protein